MRWSTRANRALGRVTGLQLRRVPRGPVLPPATHAVGAARTAKFFDKYPRFYDTSEIQTSPVQMNLRHEAIIAQHGDVFAGARIIDIASHDGRWSFAALEAGAAHVVGIEAREELVELARCSLWPASSCSRRSPSPTD